MKAAVYVDCGSLWHGAPKAARGETKKRVNYAKLLQLLKLGQDVVEARAYVIARPGVDVVGFQFALEGMGYNVRLVNDRSSARESIVSDILARADGSGDERWDKLYIASEDAMLAPVLNVLRESGIDVAWHAFRTPAAGIKLTDDILEAA